MFGGLFSKNSKSARHSTEEIEFLHKSPLLDPVWYRHTYFDLHDTPIDVARHYLEHGAREGRNPHPLFDTNFYLQKNPDVAACGMNPLVHYLRYGAKEGCNPHPLFDAKFYLEQNADVAKAQVNPAVHFVTSGWKEGRDPAPWFNTRFYSQNNSEVLAPNVNPFVHFLTTGREEGRLPCGLDFEIPLNETAETRSIYFEMCHFCELPHDLETIQPFQVRFRLLHRHLLTKFNLFDADFYRSKYLSEANIDALQHYVTLGWIVGFWPNPFFDPSEYLALNRSLLGLKLDPILHYVLRGWKDSRNAGSYFDGSQYLLANPDVAATGISPLYHFLAWGKSEGRAPRPMTSPDFWSAQNAFSSGTILIVTHDMDVGGAQEVARTLGTWLHKSTGYSVKIVAMRGGGHQFLFERVAPIFNLQDAIERSDPAGAKRELLEFAGTDVRSIIVNSIASARFFDYWDEPTPAVAYIHELRKVIQFFDDAMETLKKHVSLFFAGSQVVKAMLCDEFGVDAGKCHVVYDFIDDTSGLNTDALERRAEFKREIGADENTFLALACGTLYWRKSPDLFIELARLSKENAKHFNFIWVGGGPDESTCQESVMSFDIGDRVRFVGYQQDVTKWIRAADVFLLTSEEDPFPLVCLYAAAASIPIICFEEAGGIPELTRQGCGIAVPFKNVDAMYAALDTYASNKGLRISDGRRGKELVESKFTVRTAGRTVLYYLRQITGVKPMVSVIVPNYNHEKYLSARLESIYHQTFQDFDVILLDDASTDNSVSLLAARSALDPGTTFVANPSNTGSVFRQWTLGLSLATADRVWIAESDDFCELDFLKKILSQMQDRNVFLAYGRSVPTDAAGTVVGDYKEVYLNRICPGRWDKSYLTTDFNEVSNALGIANCIPNASAVVFRKFDLDDNFSFTIAKMKMCGDWLFYIAAIKGGYVAYVHDAVNYHRRHSSTVTKEFEGNFQYFSELQTIRKFVHNSYRLPNEARKRAGAFLEQDLERFSVANNVRENLRTDLEFAQDGSRLPSLLVVASDLSPGGGQMFSIRLANAWSRAGGRSILLNARYSADHQAVVSQLDARISLFHADDPNFKFRDLVADFDIDVVHSSIWWADKLVEANAPHLPDRVAWIVTMHGCYETHLRNPSIDPSFKETFKAMLKRVDHWVVTAEKNKAVFAQYGYPERFSKVANGFSPETIHPIERTTLGVRDDSFIICLASRAIEEKGWYEAIQATESLNKSGKLVDLLLIGEGPVADALKKTLSPSYVHIFEQVPNLQDFINLSDIGILPSYFVGESMPLVVIEFLAQGRPVVGTEIGEIRHMLTSAEGLAGRVVPLRLGRVSPGDLIEAIEALMDATEWKKVSRNAMAIYSERYSMTSMLQSYEAIYAQSLQSRAAFPGHSWTRHAGVIHVASAP